MVTYKIEWGSEAKLDLIDIYSNLISQLGTNSYCKNLNAKLNRTIKLLGKNPFIGAETNSPNVRLMIFQDYQIFYKVLPESILIAMICECRKIDMSKNYSLKNKAKKISKIIFE